MINTETAQTIHTTVAEQSAYYPIGFQYDVLPDTGAPELLVTLDGVPLTYGTDYTVNVAGLQLVNAPEAGQVLTIKRDVAFTQEIDLQTGFISPDQIENGLDRAVMRDQELKRNVLDVAAALAEEQEERRVTDAGLQEAIDNEVLARTAADTTLQDNIDDEALTRANMDAALRIDIDSKQPAIGDLETIRAGAAAGATAVQPGDLADVATSGSYNDLLDKPTNIVNSVNGQTGIVVLNASDVGALPGATKYAASIALTIDPTTFVVTAQLKDQDNNNIGTAQTIDLPLESVVVSGAYDSVTKEVVLTLEGGSTIRFSVADLVSGLQTEITSQNKLDADLVDDSTSTNKFVTTAEKTTWNSALQSGDDVSELVNDAGYLTNTDVAADYVAKTGDRMTGVLEIKRPVTSEDMSPTCVKFTNNIGGTPVELSVYNAGDLGLSGGLISGTILSNMHNTYDIGATYNKWRVLYVTKINNGADITVPASGGTMARVEDLPSVMTGADGTNAGTSGLVPAPAATDNDKFLSGDGTWKTAGGGATYTAGAGISIDANNEISVTDPVLVNNSTSGTARLAVGDGATAGQNTAQAFGTSAHANSNGSLAVGYGAQAQGNYSTAISGATSAVRAIQLGYNGLNSDANTFKVANANGNFEIMSADGTIPEARLADTTNAAQGQVLTLDSNLNAVWQAGGGGSSYTAGTGIDITNNAIGVTDPVLINSSYNIGTDNITIGGTAAQVYNGYSINIGGGSEANGYFAVALGNSATAKGSGSIAIGAGATAGANALTNRATTIGNNICTGDHSTLIGSTTSNTYTLSDSDTFAFANNNGMFKLVDANGNIPTARLTKVNTTTTLAAADWSSNTQTVSVTGMTADGVVMVSPTPANQSAYTSAGILCTAQAAGSLTFTCDTVPSADIDVNVVCL